MTNLSKYRITREEYCNEYGVGAGPSFYVQQLKPFLFFWTRWVYIKHEECGYGDCYKVKTRFKSKPDALEFIKQVLCGNLKRDTFSRHILEEYNCNNIK